MEDHILKSATISSTVACPAFTEMYMEASPIVRVAVEPKHPGRLTLYVLSNLRSAILYMYIK